MYKGELIMMEWTSAMLGDVYMRYTNPGTEEPLIYVSSEPVITKKPSAMMVNKQRQWTEQFNNVIMEYGF